MEPKLRWTINKPDAESSKDLKFLAGGDREEHIWRICATKEALGQERLKFHDSRAALNESWNLERNVNRALIGSRLFGGARTMEWPRKWSGRRGDQAG